MSLNPIHTVSGSRIWKDSNIGVSNKSIGGVVLPVPSPHFETTSRMSHSVTTGLVYLSIDSTGNGHLHFLSGGPIKKAPKNHPTHVIWFTYVPHFCWVPVSYAVCTCTSWLNTGSMFSPVVQRILTPVRSQRLSFHTVIKAVKFLHFCRPDGCVCGFTLWL